MVGAFGSCTIYGLSCFADDQHSQSCRSRRRAIYQPHCHHCRCQRPRPHPRGRHSEHPENSLEQPTAPSAADKPSAAQTLL